MPLFLRESLRLSISTKLMVDGNIFIGKTRVLESILKLEEAHEGGIISPVDI